MSFPADCPACVMGNHEGHDPKHGLREGLIGGTRCDCVGDCADRLLAWTRAAFGAVESDQADTEEEPVTESEPDEELIGAFQLAWHEADERGEAGQRTRAGLRAVLAALGKRDDTAAETYLPDGEDPEDESAGPEPEERRAVVSGGPDRRLSREELDRLPYVDVTGIDRIYLTPPPQVGAAAVKMEQRWLELAAEGAEKSPLEFCIELAKAGLCPCTPAAPPHVHGRGGYDPTGPTAAT